MIRHPLALACAAISLACAATQDVPPSSAAAEPAPKTVTLDEPPPDAAARLAVGDALVVRLGAQLGTGYGWSVAALPDALVQDGPPEIDRDPSGQDHQRFRFTARARGGGALVLELRRPWRKEDPPARAVTVHVTVE